MKLMTTIVQEMKGYDVVATPNGDIFYWLDDIPQYLFNTGESVSPDELTAYTFDEMTIERILDLCDMGLYSDFKIY